MLEADDDAEDVDDAAVDASETLALISAETRCEGRRTAGEEGVEDWLGAPQRCSLHSVVYGVLPTVVQGMRLLDETAQLW